MPFREIIGDLVKQGKGVTSIQIRPYISGVFAKALNGFYDAAEGDSLVWEIVSELMPRGRIKIRSLRVWCGGGTVEGCLLNPGFKGRAT